MSLQDDADQEEAGDLEAYARRRLTRYIVGLGDAELARLWAGYLDATIRTTKLDHAAQDRFLAELQQQLGGPQPDADRPRD